MTYDEMLKEYASLTRQEWADELVRLIPEHMRGGMLRWLLYGIPPGSFLQAVIGNDRFEALRRADETNALLINNYSIFFYNYAPIGARQTGWRGLVEAIAQREKANEK